MADYIQYEGQYPELENVPELITIGAKPTPNILYSQEDNDYPTISGFPDLVNFNSPTPFLLYAQKNSYPYLDTPDTYELFTKPVPFLFYTPNKAKKTTHKVVVQKTKSQTIIITKHKQQFISMIDEVIT
mgnify:CR=1 FL=1